MFFQDNTLAWNGELYKQIAAQVQITQHIPRRRPAAYFDTPTIRSQLFILNNFVKDFKFVCECYQEAYTADIVNTIKEEKRLPSLLRTEGYPVTYSQTTPGFRIIESIKYNARIFPALDTWYKDEKLLSMTLQETVTHKVRVYKDPNNPYVYTILTNEWTWNMARKLVALMPKLFNITLPTEIDEMFKLFGTDKFEEWHTAYYNWVDTLHLLDAFKKAQLQTALNSYRTAKIQSIQNNITNTRATIEQYLKALPTYYRDLQEYNTLLTGYKLQPDETCEDLFTYLNKNKSIKNFEVTNTYMLTLVIETAWDYYDENCFKTLASNPNSDLNQRAGGDISKLFQKIFTTKNPRFELWSRTKCVINLQNPAEYSAYKFNRQIPPSDGWDMIPQTHIHYFGCWGSNSGYIRKAMGNQELIAGIEQIIAATKNLNWYDDSVTGYLTKYLANTYKHVKSFKDLKTGAFVSYTEALNLLKYEEEGDQANEVY